MGLWLQRITQPEDIKPIAEQALDNNRPTLVDVHIDPDEMPSYNARSEAMASFTVLICCCHEVLP